MSEEELFEKLEEEVSETPEEKPKKKRSLKFKILMVAIIVVAVLGVAGGSVYLIFHDNPNFCNAVCHTPMDPYVESYLEGTSVNANEKNLTADLSVVFHKNQQANGKDILCVTCHDSGIIENMREGVAWVTGSYELPLEMHLSSAQGVGDKYGVEFCLKSGCHTNDAGQPIEDAKALQASTADEKVNPHLMSAPSEIDQMQHEKYYVEGGLLDCSSCHQTHEQSVMLCTECHSEGLDGEARIATVPEGWLTFAESVKAKKK
ncbi:MAG TPA: hypothetical protein DEB24_05545 [Coriobacteriia bacterium]|nr:hypothetical protein [Coriobacteriia bacterium]